MGRIVRKAQKQQGEDIILSIDNCAAVGLASDPDNAGFVFFPLLLNNILGILATGTSTVFVYEGRQFFRFCCRLSPPSLGCERIGASPSAGHIRLIERMETMPKLAAAKTESLADAM